LGEGMGFRILFDKTRQRFGRTQCAP